MTSPIAAATLGLIFSAVGVSAAAPPPPMYDIVIRNGHLLDGDGNPWVNADVAIKDGRFVKIGRVEGRGKREIDARGDYVSPGWIDMMDQSGEVLLKNGLAENKLREGVTSGDRRRGRYAGPLGANRRLLQEARIPRDLDEFRHVLRQRPGARGSDGRCRRPPHGGAVGRDESPCR